RPGDRHGALDAPRRFPDGRRDRERSGLSHRAVHPDDRLRTEPEPARAAVPLRDGHGDRASDRRDFAPPVRDQQGRVRILRALRDPVRGHAGWRGNVVSRLPEEVADAAAAGEDAPAHRGTAMMTALYGRTAKATKTT